MAHGGPQTASEEKALKKLYQIYTHTCVCAKVPLLVGHQQKVGELIPSITPCPAFIILGNTFN
jgi:hypothetical protein